MNIYTTTKDKPQLVPLIQLQGQFWCPLKQLCKASQGRVHPRTDHELGLDDPGQNKISFKQASRM